MVELQKKDLQLSLVYDKVFNNKKPKLSEIHRIQSKPIRRLLLQFNRLSLIRGVLHRRSFKDDDEIQQLILPQQLRRPILQSLHDDNGHQGQQRVLNLLREKVYWPSMFRDTDHWLSQCERCLISKGDYIEPKTQQGSLTAQQPLELLCTDFTKADVAKGCKENILVITDAFSKYSQAIVTNNQKALTVAKILVEKWFSGLSGFLPGSTVIKADPLTTKSLATSARCMVSNKQQLHHTTQEATLYVNGSTAPYSD